MGVASIGISDEILQDAHGLWLSPYLIGNRSYYDWTIDQYSHILLPGIGLLYILSLHWLLPKIFQQSIVMVWFPDGL